MKIFGERCNHKKQCGEVFQTLYGHGLLCGKCKFVLTYEHWPQGYSLEAVPDWSKSEKELIASLTKGGKC